jgi:TrmH family RNA methyltransferase
VAKVKSHRLQDLKFNKQNPLVVVLESVEKPGNLGAILRTAEAANVDAVIVCDPLTDIYNPNLIRASIGGVFSVSVATCASKECIEFLKANKIRILTAQLQDSYDYYDYDMSHATALVMGTESTGLSQQWRDAADVHIRIPMLGRLDSLNVSVSTAILIYEAVRQRNKVYQYPDSRM